jgi:hypothetical protein
MNLLPLKDNQRGPLLQRSLNRVSLSRSSAVREKGRWLPTKIPTTKQCSWNISTSLRPMAWDDNSRSAD